MTVVEEITKLFIRVPTEEPKYLVRRSPANVAIHDAPGTSLVPVKPEPIIIPYYPEEHPPVIIPSAPPAVCIGHKIVRVTTDGRLMSLVSLIDGGLPMFYELGQTIREPARPDHGGGLFAYNLPGGMLVRRFLEGRHGGVFGELEPGSYGLMEVEAWGPFVEYSREGHSLGYIEAPGGDGKFACSEMTPRRVLARFQVARRPDEYRRLWTVTTTEVRGTPVREVQTIQA